MSKGKKPAKPMSKKVLKLLEDLRRRRGFRTLAKRFLIVCFAHVWCVIDGDYGDRISNARAKAQARGIKLALSTMCFEYWVLLHFEESGKSTVDCDGLVRALTSKHIPKYEKGKCDFHEIVKGVRVACKRAEKLRKPGIDRGDFPEDQNPCGEIYLLVNAILGETEETAQSETCGITSDSRKKRVRATSDKRNTVSRVKNVTKKRSGEPA